MGRASLTWSAFVVTLALHTNAATTDKAVSASCQVLGEGRACENVLLLQTSLNLGTIEPLQPKEPAALTQQDASSYAGTALEREVDDAPWMQKVVLLASEALRTCANRDFDPFNLSGAGAMDLHPPNGNPLNGTPDDSVAVRHRPPAHFKGTLIDGDSIMDLHPPRGNPLTGGILDRSDTIALRGHETSAGVPPLKGNPVEGLPDSAGIASKWLNPPTVDGDSILDLHPPHGNPLGGTDKLNVPRLRKTETVPEEDAGGAPLYSGTDMWPQRNDEHPLEYRTGDEGLNFFTAARGSDWLVLAIAIVVLCALDYCVMQRFMGDSFRMHIVVLGIWVVVAVVFCMIIWARLGSRKAVEWSSGYVLEWMLSMDNLFVFHLVFRSYKTPPEQIHKAVFVGIVGAIVARMIFFMVVSTLLHVVGWIRWPFGLLLVWSGIEAARGEDDEDDDVDVEDSRLMRVLRFVFGSRISAAYEESGAMITWSDEGVTQLTMLFVVVACLETSDILFALDSVSAKVAQIPDQYIAFSSSVIAMYGLRAMFFIIQDLVEMFDMLKYGLCLILVFIGVELMFARYIHLSCITVLIIILAVFAVSIAASFAKTTLLPETDHPLTKEGDSPLTKEGLAEPPAGRVLENTRENGSTHETAPEG